MFGVVIVREVDRIVARLSLSFTECQALLLAIDPVLHHRRLYVQGFDDVLAAEVNLEDFTRCVRHKI